MCRKQPKLAAWFETDDGHLILTEQATETDIMQMSRQEWRSDYAQLNRLPLTRYFPLVRVTLQPGLRLSERLKPAGGD
jgi:hypothetical protein